MNKLRQIAKGFKNPATRSTYISVALVDAAFIFAIILSLVERDWPLAGLFTLAYAALYFLVKRDIIDLMSLQVENPLEDED